MMRLIPPVAVPWSAAEVLASALDGSERSSTELSSSLAEIAGFASVELFTSGRAALTSFLETGRDERRNEVLVPAYTCWSVAASVVRAGLRVRLVDIDPSTLAPDPVAVRAADPTHLSAFVVTHLLARAIDPEPLARMIKTIDPAIRVVEDAAQCWPRERAPSVDALLLSFGRGKPLPLGGGGALAHDRPADIRGPAIAGGGWSRMAQLAATCVFARPAWYRLPESLPWLGVGETVYEPDFRRLDPFRRWQVELGVKLLPRMAAVVEGRTRHAARLARAIAGAPGWEVPRAAAGSGPLRFPVLAPSCAARDEALRLLRGAGVAASRMYPGTLAEIPALREHLANPESPLPGARAVAARLLTLPTYPTLSDRDVERVALLLRDIAERLRS